MFSVFIFSCSTGNNENRNNNSDNQNDNEKSESYITLTNSTASILEVYDDSLRNTLLAKIASGESENLSVDFSNNSEKIFYLTYHINVGLDVPFYDNSSYVIFTSDGTTEKSVSYPSSMNVKSAYIVLENNSSDSTSEIELYRGSSPLYPNGKSSTLVSTGKSAVYELKNAVLTNLNYSSFKISDLNGTETELPTAISYFESGVIYTISYNENSTSLLSKTAFNLDTKNKIWSRESYGSPLSSSQFITHVLRTRYDSSNGSIVAGVLNSAASNINQRAKIILIDEYGNIALEETVSISNSEGSEARNYLFYDLAETSTGDFVALVKVEFFDKTRGTYFIVWDSSLKTCKWSYKIDQDDSAYLFAVNTKGKIVELGTDSFTICGSRDNVPFLEKITYNFADNTVTAMGVSTGSTTTTTETSPPTTTENENIFTSMVFDGTSFILTGYTNFDGEYSSSNQHYGIVYKVSSDLQTSEQIYSKANCLFYGIDLDDEKNYYICGELADNGNALHGCFISSTMISSSDEIQTFDGSGTHSWFTQLCTENNRITFSGQTCADTSGSESSALLMAINKNGEEMWKNEFSDYDAVYSCMTNGIGSFLVELYDATTKQSKIVSTDLLGNDTGTLLGTFGN